MDIEIRAFELESDGDLCVEAEKAAHRDANPSGDFTPENVQDTLARIGMQIEEGTYVAFTAVVEGKPVGLVFADREGEFAYIDNLYIVADKRGQGIGGALMERVLEFLEASGVREIELMVTADNAAAVGLYENAGFEVTRLRMRKSIRA